MGWLIPQDPAQLQALTGTRSSASLGPEIHHEPRESRSIGVARWLRVRDEALRRFYVSHGVQLQRPNTHARNNDRLLKVSKKPWVKLSVQQRPKDLS